MIGHFINLEHRPDRLISIQNEIKKIDFINFSKMDAIYNPTNGKKGLTDTIKILINDAKSNNFDYVLFVEDDLWILSSDKIHKSLLSLPDDWDILLGGVYYLSNLSIYNEHWMKVDHFCGLHFTIINKKAFDTVLKYDGDKSIPLDIYLSRQKLNIYVMNPMPCRQYGGYSDIRKMSVDYNDRILPFIKIN